MYLMRLLLFITVSIFGFRVSIFVVNYVAIHAGTVISILDCMMVILPVMLIETHTHH